MSFTHGVGAVLLFLVSTNGTLCCLDVTNLVFIGTISEDDLYRHTSLDDTSIIVVWVIARI